MQPFIHLFTNPSCKESCRLTSKKWEESGNTSCNHGRGLGIPSLFPRQRTEPNNRLSALFCFKLLKWTPTFCIGSFAVIEWIASSRSIVLAFCGGFLFFYFPPSVGFFDILPGFCAAIRGGGCSVHQSTFIAWNKRPREPRPLLLQCRHWWSACCCRELRSRSGPTHAGIVGFSSLRVWTDLQGLISVQYLHFLLVRYRTRDESSVPMKLPFL